MPLPPYSVFEMARANGFNNISIDLIYSIPGQDDATWQKNIEKAVALQPEHISSYSLTIEEKTAFGRWAAKGKLKGVGDDVSAAQLEQLVDSLNGAGYEQYEVSNFARPGILFAAQQQLLAGAKVPQGLGRAHIPSTV